MASNRSRFQVAFLFVYSLTVGLAVLHAQDSTMREVGRRDWESSLPDGEGKGLVLGVCTQCHSLNSTALQRKTSREWERTVFDMVARGAQLQPAEIPIVATYLAKSFGLDAPPGSISAGNPAAPRIAPGGQSLSGSLPEGLAKGVLQRSCTQCHGLDKIAAATKTEAGWRASVKDMIRLGAKLKPDEDKTVVAYLVEHFGPKASSTMSRAEPNASSSRTNEVARDSVAADPSQLLPDGEGKGLILATCVQCHNLRYVVGQRKDAEGWRRTVHDMVARGTQVTSDEAEIIARYLAEHRSMEKRQR